MLLFPGQYHFLGHVLSADGISANQEKIDKVTRLAGAKELHSFLGLASYYCWLFETLLVFPSVYINL